MIQSRTTTSPTHESPAGHWWCLPGHESKEWACQSARGHKAELVPFRSRPPSFLIHQAKHHQNNSPCKIGTITTKTMAHQCRETCPQRVQAYLHPSSSPATSYPFLLHLILFLQDPG